MEVVFELMFRLVGQRQTNQGFAVIGVSLAISLLTLPLYRRADAVQQKERDLQKKLSYWVSHIKKHFKGDERFMMLQTYYRENGYSPLQALNGSISLLLEIPFFIAAYHFLSHLQALDGASFGLILDLGKPDSLIKIGSFSLNLLPIMMTAINCVSSAIYLKGFPLKDKIQTYGMALIFLVLLYNSPSGLVVYWTCNNIFSLVKNIFYKLKNPKKVLNWLCVGFGTVSSVTAFASGILNSKKKCMAVCFFLFCTYLPICFDFINRMKSLNHKKQNSFALTKSVVSETGGISFFSFFLPAIILALLTGILIPSGVIASSPSEFTSMATLKNPNLILVNSICYALGFFVLWLGIIYNMLEKRGRKILSALIYAASIAGFLDCLSVLHERYKYFKNTKRAFES